MEGTLVAHSNTVELPTVTTAAAHYAETALLQAKHPIKAGGDSFALFSIQVLASIFPEGLHYSTETQEIL